MVLELESGEQKHDSNNESKIKIIQYMQDAMNRRFQNSRSVIEKEIELHDPGIWDEIVEPLEEYEE